MEKELRALEAKLKQQLKLKHPDEKVVKPIRRELQDKYVRAVLCDAVLATRIGAETNLWKLCYYKKIEEFRRALARGQEHLADPAKSAAAEQVLAATMREFGRFLDKGTTFYLALLQRAAKGSSLVLPGYDRATQAPWPAGLDTGEGSVSAAQQRALVSTCYRCLICLGDLERYRGSCQSELATYDWTAAEEHYRTALLLRPYSGNPHNQCGVLANYRGDDLAGFYHYFRAILCNEPYLPQARANLEMICRRNRDSALVDMSASSQQRRCIAQDASLRALTVGRSFVRPLCLLSLLSNSEDVAAAQSDVLSKLPAWLDADSCPSGLCLRLICACIFTASDLEQRVQEACTHVEGSDENQNGNKPHDLALLRDCYQHALDFTLRVTKVMMHSAKSSHHHLEAVSAVCLWLWERPYLISPQSKVEKVAYDCERLRRAQQSLAEGLVDLLNLLDPQHAVMRTPLHKGALSAALAAGCALPEDLLLMGCTPFSGTLAGLLQTGACQDHSPTDGVGVSLLGDSLLGVSVVDKPEELLARRLQRVAGLAHVLAEAPGPVLCIDAGSGELSVEGVGGTRKRSRQLAKPPAAAAVPEQQQQQQRSSAAPAACAAADVPSRGGAGAQVCGECGSRGQAGREDEYDGLFYCDVCWANLDALESGGDGVALLAHRAAGEGEQGAAVPVCHIAMEMQGLCAGNGAGDEAGDDDDEAFGSLSMPVDGTGVSSGLGELAQQTALFAAAASTRFEPWRPSQVAQAPWPRPASPGCNRPQGSEEAEYGYLEDLVLRTVDAEPQGHRVAPSALQHGLGADTGALAMGRQADADDDEEMIVFQPRSRAVSGGEGSCVPDHVHHGLMPERSEFSSALKSDASAGAPVEFLHPRGIGSVLPAQSSLWGGFGGGTYGFGVSSGPSLGGSTGAHMSDAERREGGREERSRFSTRNPFAE